MSEPRIRVRVGDIFESHAQTLVNTVNTVGVMGKGIALQFKKRFPEMHADYVRRCAQGEVRLGQPYLYTSLIPPWILNFPTKEHWRSVSKVSDIVAGLEFLGRHHENWGITSLAVPPLGCGEGGLEWRVVGRTLFRHLQKLDIPVELYAPFGTPLEELESGFLAQTDAKSSQSLERPSLRIQPGWIAIVEILSKIVREPHHWPVGRTRFQKLAYFATEAGIPTGLEYSKGSYGPFAEDLKPLITRLVNQGLIQEQRLDRTFAVVPGPTYRDARDAFKREIETWGSIIDRVTDLCLRFRTTNEAEIAASVHFAARNLAQRPGAKPDEKDILREVKKWKHKRRPPLDERQIALAIRAMGGLGWIEVEPSEDLPLPNDELLGV